LEIEKKSSRHFLLNETKCFGKNNVVSSTVKKKRKKREKAQNGVVLNDTMGLCLPLDARRKGRKSVCSPSSIPLSLSLSPPLKPNKNPHLPKL